MVLVDDEGFAVDDPNVQLACIAAMNCSLDPFGGGEPREPVDHEIHPVRDVFS